MKSSVKREAAATGDRGGRREADDEWKKPKIVKKEKQSKSGIGSERSQEPPIQEEEEQGIADRRAIRSQYLTLIHKIKDAKDDLTTIDSAKFNSIINEVENLHQKVQKPREQIADAEALLDLANSVVSSVKSQSANGVSPAEFVNALINGFGQTSLGIDNDQNTQVLMKWKDMGFAVCSTVLVSCGCSTMIGPMDTELKQRKSYRKRTKLGAGVKPEEVDDTETEKKTDTDKNMAIMFNILRKNKRVKIENLVLNRKSFAQTVENVFALSFLVKDGRVEIIVDKNGSHFAVPRNAPEANLVMSGEVVYSHFVLRFDYKDWEPMCTMVAVGEELMPHRETKVASSAYDLSSKKISQDSQTTPIRKLSMKQGLMTGEETAVEDSSDIDSINGGTRRKCKLRRLNSEDGS
ncbi:Non-structural maintenance of chromosomes element 4-like protein [Cardamine amara subsp. amara]|uniref:Non-structural maintenance of chromosomes element 4 n=1 Tax=Cardamine amara subsp. amara TaxID=228776 RepID=A0ABD0ZRY2_CARAN